MHHHTPNKEFVMNRALLVGLAAVAVGAAAPVAASATVSPECTNTGVILHWTGFDNPGRHQITYSIDGHVKPVTASVANGESTEVTIWSDTAWLRITIRERWGSGPKESLVMETFSNCVGNPPEDTPPPVTPPTAPEPPVVVIPPPYFPPIEQPVLPGPDNPCPAAMRNVYRTKAGPRWVREAVARGCVKVKRAKKCPRRYSSRTVVIPVRTKAGRVVNRRVKLCVPPRRPADNPTG